jgi:vacuolar-type H+-ATPase subunit F/Vma7
MSRLLVVTRPDLATGFELAGVETFVAQDVEEAEELIGGWLDDGEKGLLAIDETLLLYLNPGLIQRLQASPSLPYLGIPGGQPLDPRISRRGRITEMIRQAIGFHITFKGEQAGVEET